jgi:hypothetical protein
MKMPSTNSWDPAREEFYRIVNAAIAFKRLDLQNADDVRWLRRWTATALGYVLVLSKSLGERAYVESFRHYCLANHQPLIVLRAMPTRLELTIDMSSARRDMTAEESHQSREYLAQRPDSVTWASR